MKVLIVDDTRSMTRILRRLLEKIGYDDVDEAADGREALAKIHTDDFDLVLCDVRMAPLNGIEVVRQVRADPELHDLPMVMVTSETRREWIKAAKDAGADGYLIKPFDGERLMQAMDHALERAAA